MLTCKELTERAESYVTDDLSMRRRLSIRIHLMMCKHCRRYIRHYRTTQGVLKHMLKPQPKGSDYLPAWHRIQALRKQGNQTKPDDNPD